MEAACSPADPVLSPTRPLPVLSVGREGAATGNPAWDAPRKEGRRPPYKATPMVATPNGTTPMCGLAYRATPTGSPVHEIPRPHRASPTGRPRPLEATPTGGHTHTVGTTPTGSCPRRSSAPG